MDGELDWSFVYRVDDGVLGEMGHPGEWTNDFEVWIEDVTSNLEHRRSLAERLVHFADDGSERLVAGAGAGHRRPDRRRGAAQLGDSTRAARSPR